MSRAEAARRRVLVVAYTFPPHAAIGTMRTLRVVRQMHARGWNVTVLTGDPSGYLPSTPVDLALLDKIPPDVRVIRAGAVRPWEHVQRVLLRRRRGGDARRWDGPAVGDASAGKVPVGGPAPGQRGMLLASVARVKDIVDAALSIPDRESGWWAPALIKGAIDQVRVARPDVIYSSAPPWTGQLVAAGLKQALRRPWVADFRDPWSRAPWREDRYRFAMRAAAILERFVIRRADRVVFVAAANRDDFAAYYGPAIASKFDVVPNGCDPSEFDSLGEVAVPANGLFVMLHAGSLYAGRTPMPLLNALATAIDHKRLDPGRFRLRFLGTNGTQGVDLPGMCRKLGLQDVVEFLARVPREESLRAMMSASSLLLLQPGHTVSVPGKVYEYLASGRPIFAIVEEGEVSDLVRRSGMGISMTPTDEAVIEDALVAAVERGVTSVAPPPRELFDGNIGATQIASILEAVVEAKGARVTLADAEVQS